MLHHLPHINPFQLSLRNGLQIGYGVSVFHWKMLVPAKRDHILIDVDSPDAGFSLLGQKLHKLAPAATDIQNPVLALQIFQVFSLTLLDFCPAAPVLHFKHEVINTFLRLLCFP